MPNPITNFYPIGPNDMPTLNISIGSAQPGAVTSVLLNDEPVAGDGADKNGNYPGPEITIPLPKGSELIGNRLDVKTMLQPIQTPAGNTTPTVTITVQTNGVNTTYESVLTGTIEETLNYDLSIIFTPKP